MSSESGVGPDVLDHAYVAANAGWLERHPSKHPVARDRLEAALEAVWPEPMFTPEEARGLLTLQGGPVRYTAAEWDALDAARTKLRATVSTNPTEGGSIH